MYKLMLSLARALAIVGGSVLVALILLTCASIAGRLLNGLFHSDMVESALPGLSARMLALGIGPINGDFEVTEAGIAFAIFCFLPLCQITAGHASVDILTNGFSAAANRVLRAVIETVFAGVLILIAWRLMDGMLSKRAYGETTFLLQFPIWWAYALSFSAAAVAALVGLYMSVIRITEALTGRIIVLDGVESGN